MAKEETKSHMIERLAKNPIQVRNIATSAHIHHGKCISADSRLIMTDGTIKTAKEIFEEVSNKGELYEENEDHTVFIPSKKIEIFSLNKITGKIEKKPIQYSWRLCGGRTIKVKLRNGFEITTTPEHRYMVFGDGFNDIEAKDLKLGDRIVCSRRLDISNKINIKKEILDKLSEKNFYVNLKIEFSKLLNKRILEHGIKNIKFDIKGKSFYHGIWQNRYNLKDLLNICRIFSISVEDIYNQIEVIFFRTGKQRGHNSFHIKLPQDFKEFFYLAGLFLGDGSERKFIAGKSQLSESVQRICKSLGFETKRVECRNRTPEVHTNLTLVHVLNSLFDYPLKQKSHNIKISEFVWKNNKENIAMLIRGYFDTDGCVEKSRRAITISSASKKMIDDLHLLLLRFGCIAIKEKDNTLSISGISAINFNKEIGFALNEKIEKLEILVKKVSGSIVCDTIKTGNQVMLITKKLKDVLETELSYVEVKQIESCFDEVVYDFTVPETHNFIAEGMFIHNTAMTDNLLAAAGFMASKYAGELEGGMATWQHADEQERLLTVDAANVSMVHKFQDKEYLINLIDTPGHVDFSGNVTRAMRAIDGTIVLVCASEGIMPQTETVIKQALRERVKPILFINKVDRLIKELKLTPEGMRERFMQIFHDFNKLIEEIADPEFKQKWKVDITDGSVCFGSARDNWGMSVPFMKKKGISFKDVMNIYSMPNDEREKWVWDNAALYEVLLDSVIKHLPDPITAQKYRIPKIWHGDINSEFGQDLLNCNSNGKLAFVITRIVIDPTSGKEISAGRLFSGKLKAGQEVYLNLAKSKQRVQQVLIYNGIKPESVDEIPSGNVLAISGIVGRAGETITSEPEEPFQELKHIFEPVITKAIEPVKSMDLPKLIEVLKKVSKEDPSIKIEINEETGENLMHGMGELHLEIIENRIKTEKNVDVKSSAPIVVYREAVTKKSPEAIGKTPNKHNLFFMTVEPLEDSVYESIKNGEIAELRTKKKEEELWRKLSQLGVSNEEARQYQEIYRGCVLLDKTRGIVQLEEVIGLIMDAFEQVIDQGPLAREPCMKLKISLIDCKLHEDAIHRGPAQVYPAIRDAIREGMAKANAVMFEPIQIHLIEVPLEYMGDIMKLVSKKRGQILNVDQEMTRAMIRAKLPVSEMLGWSSDLRSATGGRGVSSLVDQMFEKMPSEIQQKVIKQIRQRKGISD